ncbi:cysteine-rich receptor-like protein kinase 44 [Triticum urartu]|uniref:Cysteine-rich receptor-like protein kinase 10 n=1 Tax=Triticum urartu TaxID=4572 RepID=A0A8R7QAS7_TRIUA|nr:cysteine-rich receptor-like protein kinase 44 [Triticum urartu]
MPTMPSRALALVLLLLAASKAASQGVCIDPRPSSAAAPAPPTSNTTNSSAFRTNVLTLLNALPQAVAPTGFASLSLGTGRDRAFVRGLCRGDTTPSQCLADMQASVIDLRGRCASNRSAAAYYDKAYITFADTNDTINLYYEKRSLNALYDVLTVSDPESFDQTYNVLMKRLVARAASEGGNTSAMFATGEAVYAPSDPKGTMYGLVQCMRDLSASQCDWCLQSLVPVLPTCCYGYQGGVARNFNCLLRIQIYTFYDLALDAPPPAAPTPGSPDETRRNTRLQHVILAVAISVGTLFVLVVVLACVRRQRKRIKADKEQQDNAGEGLNYISLQVLRVATSNFSINNKLGEGGFGEVFKGEMQDGMKIAVKRLSKDSVQGFGELKNELVLANKLKHKNLVQLLGVCLQEKLLVYEYMPNGSLDTIIFNSEKAHQLDWMKRSMIISGIARGLLYLHQESRLKVIHRDLKPSNVLLDLDMNPKISDFGLSRAFGGDQSMDVTKRAVGTLGYMAPEYAYHGQVSTKSDMYSFGVVVVEIVTGRRNNASLDDDTASRSLLSQVWEAWSAGSMEEVVDPSLGRGYPKNDVLKCVQIGLLCLQEDPSARPAAWEVVLMLDSPSMSMTMRTPTRPAFCFTQPGVSNPTLSYQSSRGAITSQQLPTPVSGNDVTISDVEPR